MKWEAGRLREGWVLGTKRKTLQVPSKRKDLDWLQGVLRTPGLDMEQVPQKRGLAEASGPLPGALCKPLSPLPPRSPNSWRWEFSTTTPTSSSAKHCQPCPVPESYLRKRVGLVRHPGRVSQRQQGHDTSEEGDHRLV